jgi:pimeloyl-ACP methyl ester carboxylesterase
VEQLADHLGLRRFAVLGISGGGPHALACAYAIPHRLTCVGIVSSITSPETMPRVRDLPARNRPAIVIGRYLPWPLLVGFYAPFSWLTRAFPRLAYAIRTARPADEDADETGAPVVAIPKHITPVMREQLTEPFRHGARAHAQDMRVFQQNWGFRIADIRGVEVYLWHGEQDPNAPAVMGHELAEAIPGCHATFYPDEGHNVSFNHLGEILSTLGSNGDEVAAASYGDSDSAEL